MISDLKDLLASLSGGRPLVVALLVIAICFLLLRPRRKQSPPPAAAAGAGSSSGGPQQKLPALSLSTRDILLEFVNGAPQLKQERRPAQNGALALGGDRSRLSAPSGLLAQRRLSPRSAAWAQAASRDSVQQTVPRPAPKLRAPPP